MKNNIEFIPNLNLYRESTISDAFRSINGRFGMVVTVVDESHRLCGVASEGDLRRAILRGHSLDTPIGKVMNSDPVTLRVDELRRESQLINVVEKIYNRYGTGWAQQITIPVVDEAGSVMGLVVPEMLQAGELGGKVIGSVLSTNPQVLVVGGAGYVGSVFVRMLLERGWRVRVLDNMLYGQTSLDGLEGEKMSLLRGDVTNINDMVKAIEGIDAVVYLAEIVGDAACAYRPERALKTNYLSTVNAAHLSAYLNINRFVYASSCSVYGGSSSPEKFLSEESELNPVSHYGRMKIMNEQALLGISNPLFAPTILRLATIFGYSHRPRFDLVVNSFARNAFFRKYIEIFGGNQWRPNVHVADVAGAIIKVLEAPIEKVSRKIFNVGGNSQNYTINELAALVGRAFPDVETRRSKLSGDQRNYRVDFSKIERELGYRAKLSVLHGLEELKSIFAKGEIVDPDRALYSNIEAIRELTGGLT